jgi:hypothetical protein
VNTIASASVEVFEAAGARGILLEDQVTPLPETASALCVSIRAAQAVPTQFYLKSRQPGHQKSLNKSLIYCTRGSLEPDMSLNVVCLLSLRLYMEWMRSALSLAF